VGKIRCTPGIGRARQLQVEVRYSSLHPPEYVIVRKIEYYREGARRKHLRDIAPGSTRPPRRYKSRELSHRWRARPPQDHGCQVQGVGAWTSFICRLTPYAIARDL